MAKEISDWKKDMAMAATKVAKTERSDDSYISLKGGVMTYQDQPIPDNKLECIIVATSFARTCFNRPYDSDDNEPPECFANAIDQADLMPHENVPAPFSTACGEKVCEMAVFGSALQGNGPRCKTRRKLIVMPSSGLIDPTEAEIAILAVPPTSGKHWSAYANRVASGAGLPPWAVKTMITVKPNAKTQFEVTFETTGPIEDDKLLSAIHARIPEAEKILLQPYTYDEPAEEVKTANAKY